MKHFQLKPDFHLLNPDFEGYKLSLDALPSYVTPLDSHAPLQVHLDNSQYSVQHLKTYANRSSLVLNPFDGSLVFFGVDGGVFQSQIQEGKIVFRHAFQLQMREAGFSIPPSVLFASSNLAVISDSKKVVFCHLQQPEGGGGGGGGDGPDRRWRELTVKQKEGDEADDEVSSMEDCVLMDAFCEGNSICHVVMQRVRKKENDAVEEEEGEQREATKKDEEQKVNEKSSAFCSELIWTAYNIGEDDVTVSWRVRLESPSSAEFVGVDRGARFLSIASQHPFKLFTCSIDGRWRWGFKG